jgi:hypothetical protein
MAQGLRMVKPADHLCHAWPQILVSSDDDVLGKAYFVHKANEMFPGEIAIAFYIFI